LEYLTRHSGRPDEVKEYLEIRFWQRAESPWQDAHLLSISNAREHPTLNPLPEFLCSGREAPAKSADCCFKTTAKDSLGIALSK